MKLTSTKTCSGNCIYFLYKIVSKDIPFSGWNGRIVGGSQASANQFPHQASLQSNANAHFCGAFIINNRWVGSAAHCTINRTPDNTRVRVGSNDRSTGGTLFQAITIRNHPDFDHFNIVNDVSTVQTAGIITFSIAVQPITLATSNTGALTATISGWGQTSVTLQIFLKLNLVILILYFTRSSSILAQHQICYSSLTHKLLPILTVAPDIQQVMRHLLPIQTYAHLLKSVKEHAWEIQAVSLDLHLDNL